MAEATAADFRAEDHGSVALLRPLNDGAWRWVADHMGDGLLFFGRAVCVEPRYMPELIEGIEADGYAVERR